VPAKTFREKEILPTSSGGEGENDIRLRPAKTKPQYLLLHPAMPNPRDERLIKQSHHLVRWPAAASSPAYLNLAYYQKKRYT
ncbi:hypothetical protein, partial [[Clostridium] symbiosum]|uniref:hypothetical protein n=1 Tax=Clostridium symbiosum TaxID=1512 RepID=UPI001A9AA96F